MRRRSLRNALLASAETKGKWTEQYERLITEKNVEINGRKDRSLYSGPVRSYLSCLGSHSTFDGAQILLGETRPRAKPIVSSKRVTNPRKGHLFRLVPNRNFPSMMAHVRLKFSLYYTFLNKVSS
jgi:hypothetical protein